jgi:hypothetical protein
MQVMTQSDMQMRIVDLCALMNAPKDFTFAVDTTLTLRSYDTDEPDTGRIAQARNDVAEIEARIESLQKKKALENAKSLPEFGVSLSHMQSFIGMPNQFSAMLMMSIPFAPWSSPEYRAMAESVDFEIRALQWERQSKIREALGAVGSLQSALRASKVRYNNFREHIVPLYLKSYEAALNSYDLNTGNLFSVLDALKMYRMSQMNERDELQTITKLTIDYERLLEIR